MRKSVVLLAALVASSAAAEGVIFSPADTEQCFAEGAPTEECIGASARLCQQDTPGGETTIGMVGCFEAEQMWWDGRLNRAYKTAMDTAKRNDAGQARIGADPVDQADALRDMQRKWIAYRDARCLWAWAQWGGGTVGGPANAECLMRATAEQALLLEEAAVEE